MENTDILLDQQLQKLNQAGKKAGVSTFVLRHRTAVILGCVLVPMVAQFISSLLGALCFLVCILGALPFCVYVILADMHKKGAAKDVRKTISAQVIPPLLREFFPDASYREDLGIPDEQIRETAVWSQNVVDVIVSRDLIRGTHRGMDLQMCHTRISWSEDIPDVENSTDQVHHNRTIWHTTFQGQWIIVQTDLRPSATVSLMEKAGSSQHFVQPVQTGNQAFHQRFEVAGEIAAVQGIMTPYRVAKLLSISPAVTGGALTMRFLPDGRVAMTLAGDNILDAHDKGPENTQQLRQYLRHSIAQVLQVVDALGLE